MQLGAVFVKLSFCLICYVLCCVSEFWTVLEHICSYVRYCSQSFRVAMNICIFPYLKLNMIRLTVWDTVLGTQATSIVRHFIKKVRQSLANGNSILQNLRLMKCLCSSKIISFLKLTVSFQRVSDFCKIFKYLVVLQIFGVKLNENVAIFNFRSM